MTMEPAPLIESAVKVIFCDNDVENDHHPESFRVCLPFGTLKLRLPWPRRISTSTSTSPSTGW